MLRTFKYIRFNSIINRNASTIAEKTTDIPPKNAVKLSFLSRAKNVSYKLGFNIII